MTQLYPNLINGEMVTTEATLDVINPANEQVIGKVPACGAAELDKVQFALAGIPTPHGLWAGAGHAARWSASCGAA